MIKLFSRGMAKLLRCKSVLAGVLFAFGALCGSADELPEHNANSDYDILEYIKAPGPTDGITPSKSQWIVTEFKPASDDRIEMGANFSLIGWDHTLWCARKGTSGTPYSFSAFLQNNNTKFRFDLYKAADRQLDFVAQANHDYTFVADGAKRQVWIDGVAKKPQWDNVPSDPFTAGGPLVIFCSYSDCNNIGGTNIGNPGRYKFYYLRAYGSDGSLKCDLVPVRRYSDGELGVLDRVSGNFYKNSGQGQFEAGADVAATSVWTGAAGDGNVRNSDNWASTNLAGRAVSVSPCAQTVVTFAGELNLQVPVTNGLDVAKVQFESCRLTEDCDWRGFNALDTAGEIFLDGHKLYVSKLNGTACIADGDYDILEYIKAPGPTDGSTPSMSQWIVTEFKPASDDRIEMGANFTVVGWDHTLWCARKDTSGTSCSFSAFLQKKNTKFRFDLYAAAGSQLGTVAQANHDYTFVADGKAKRVWIDGVAQDPPWGNVPSDPFTAGGPLVIFCSYSDCNNIGGTNIGNPGRYKFYYLRAYGSDGSLKCDLVPVRRYSDGELGVLDRVSGNFYANSGLGEFEAGRVIGAASDEGDMSEVHLDVSENGPVVNDGVLIRGAVRLVKDGSGVYQPNVAQTYRGGTVVNAGTLKFGTIDQPAGAVFSTITVNKDAVLDMNGKRSTSTCIYNYALAGTIIPPSVPGCYKDEYRCFGPNFALLGDATICGDRYNFGTPSADGIITFTMNGHTLTLETQTQETSAYVAIGAWKTLDRGTFVFKGGEKVGEFDWLKGQGPDTATVIVDADAKFKLARGFVVGDFRYGGAEWTKDKATGGVQIDVSGRYYADAYRPPVGLADGSTLDLNDYDDATKGVFNFDGGDANCASGVNGGIFPASGATITVDVSKRLNGARRIRSNAKIATWTTRPENVNFVLDDESRADGCRLLIDDEGIRLLRPGFLILFK